MYTDSEKVIKTLEFIAAQAKQGIITKIKVTYEDHFGSTVEIEEPRWESTRSK